MPIFALDGTQVAVTVIATAGVIVPAYLGYRSIMERLKVESRDIASGIDRVQTTVTNGLHEAVRRMEMMVADVIATQHISVAMDERPMFRTSPHGALVWANEAAVNLLGMTLEDLQEDGWAKAVHPDDAPRVFYAWKESVRAKTPYGPITYRYLNPWTKDITWVKAVAQPVIDSHSGDITAWVATAVILDSPPFDESAQ